MFKKIDSFRQKLFFTYLFFIVLMLVVCSEIFWFNSKLSALNRLENDYKKMMTLNLQMYKAEKAFIQTELTNEEFFKTGKSNLQTIHTQYLTENIELVEGLKEDSKNEGINLDIELNSLAQMLSTYRQLFSNTIDKVKQKGFKDYGLEGEMRRSIHLLETKYPEFEPVTMLTLRRHEKDYIIRHNNIYIERLNKAVNEALRKRYTTNKKRQSEIQGLLSAYKNSFNKLVKFDKEVNAAFDEQNQFFFNNIEKVIDLLVEKSSNHIREQTEAIHSLFFVAIAISIVVAIFSSYYLSQYITKPVIQLTNDVEETIQNNFALQIEPTEYAKDEIGILTEKFHFMIKRIRSYINEIELSNQQLEAQNSTLQNLNVELKNTNFVLQRKEEHIQKMNTVKDKFFAILSHDLRGPLTTTKGFLSIMAEHPETLPENIKRETLQKLRKSIDLQLELLSNLLDWSSAQVDEIKFSPEKISIAVMIDKNIELIAEKANLKNVMLVNSLEENFDVVADKNMVDFILRNLISNALKYSKNEGRIIISGEKNRDGVEITVADNGVGISDKQQKFILKPGIHFTTAGTANEKGTGFGLLVCKEFVEKHGGKIKIKSKEGEGTSVSFTLKSQQEIGTSKINKNRMAVSLVNQKFYNSGVV